MARPIKVITAGAEIRAELQRRANAPTSAHRDRFRAKIILLRLEGLKIATVAKRLKTSMPTVSTWSARFEAHGLDGLNDKSGRGRKPSITEKKIERVVTDATRPPKNRNAGACGAWAATPVCRTVPCSGSGRRTA
jgi:transposase